MSLILFYHEIKKIARKREKRIKKRLIFSSLSYIILMFLNSFFFYAAVVKLADAMDSKSIGLILRAGSTPASGTKSEQFEPFSNFIMVSDCFFFSSTLKNLLILLRLHSTRRSILSYFCKTRVEKYFF